MLVHSTDIFYTIARTHRVPLCIIKEQLTASAATDISLLAPYRVMIEFSKTHNIVKFYKRFTKLPII